MLKNTKSKSAKLNMAITQQNNYILKIQDSIEKILAANELLQAFKGLQDKVNDFRKEHQPNSKFRKMLRVIPAIKHGIIASTNQKVDRKLLETHKRLQEIDATIVKMGQKS